MNKIYSKLRFRRKSDQHLSAEETMFNFWIEYFDDATKGFQLLCVHDELLVLTFLCLRIRIYNNFLMAYDSFELSKKGSL